MLIVFIIIFIALYELITVMYYESLKIRLVKVGAFIDHLNTFGLQKINKKSKSF